MSAEEAAAYREQLAEVERQLAAATVEEERERLQTTRDDLIELIALIESAGEDEEDTNTAATTLEDENAEDSEVAESLSALLGMRCSAPCESALGCGLRLHSAVVLDIVRVDRTHGIMVSVLYSHPLLSSMRVCPHFLSESCTFGEKCRFSHGSTVPVDLLEEYEEPDFESLSEGCLVLISVEPLWQLGRVTSRHGDQLAVHLLSTGAEVASSIDRVLPVKEDDEPESQASSFDYQQGTSTSSSWSELKQSNHGRVTVADHGNWSGGGIGLALMKKMGYKMGEGLGKKSDGIVHAIQARICPKGVSLDGIMERGARKVVDGVGGGADSHRRFSHGRARSQQEASIFAFINKKLDGKEKAAEVEKAAKAEERQLKESSEKALGFHAIDAEMELKNLRSKEMKLLDGIRRNTRDKPTILRLNYQLELVRREISRLDGRHGRISRALEDKKKRKKDIF